MMKEVFFIGDRSHESVEEFFQKLVFDGENQGYEVVELINSFKKERVESNSILIFCATLNNVHYQQILFDIMEIRFPCIIPVKFKGGCLPGIMKGIKFADMEKEGSFDDVVNVIKVRLFGGSQ